MKAQRPVRPPPAPQRPQPATTGRVSREVLIGLALAVLTLLAFSPVYGPAAEFINFDDPLYVSRNPHVQSGLTLHGVSWAFTTFHADNWIPLAWLSLQLDAQLYGLHPWGYHLTNVLLHLASVLLLFAVLRRMTGAVWRSAIVAGLFAVHPLRVESVAWVAERKDVLGTLFWMLTLAAYAGHVRRPGWARYLLLLVTFGLGLLAKPMLVTLPFVLLLLDYWPLKRCTVAALRPADSPDDSTAGALPPTSVRMLLLEKVPLLLLAVGASVLTVLAQTKLVMPLGQYPFRVRLANALVVYVRYLAKMAWPTDLAFHYPHPGDSLPLVQVVSATLLLVAVSVVVIRARRRCPYLAVGWFWYLGTLVPVIGLVQVASQAMADRYTYIPLIGIFLMLSWGVAEVARRRQRESLAAGVAAGLVLLCDLATWAQAHYWSNSRTLWAHTLEVTGDGNALAHNGLGTALLKSEDLDGAQREFEAALRAQPDYADAYYNLGLVCVRRQQWDEALRCFDSALRCKPNDLRAIKSMGLTLLSAGRTEEALGYFVRAREADPQDPAVYHGLGNCLERQGKLVEAAAEYRHAAEQAPMDGVYRRELALVLHKQGRTADSRAEYEVSLRLDPNWPRDAIEQAWVLATHPEAARRNGVEALRLAEQACQAVGQPPAEFLDTLAAASAEAGLFSQAASTAERAAAVADSEGRGELAGHIRERGALYAGGRQFRDPGSVARSLP
jgi:Flp pilus assembly protein TadD